MIDKKLHDTRIGLELPEGVYAWGWRYQAIVKSPLGSKVIGEYETVEEAQRAYSDAMNARWHG